jgi:hypothetical protein
MSDVNASTYERRKRTAVRAYLDLREQQPRDEASGRFIASRICVCGHHRQRHDGGVGACQVHPRRPGPMGRCECEEFEVP